ncbi:hypothetical protein J6590_076904 [Homalodisca vitripennis]|nr:hypothetical protein J6590_076904 [Homalodisca vitripennis]
MSVYLSPNDRISAFRQKLANIENAILKLDGEVIVGGDFNAKSVEWGADLSTFSIGTAPTPAPQHNLQKKKWNAGKLDLEVLRDFLTRNSSSFQNNPTPNIRHETEATVSKTMGLITALPHVMLLCHDGKGEALIVWHIGGHKR